VVAFRLNDKDVTAQVPEDAPLLYVLVNDFRINGAKFGCVLRSAAHAPSSSMVILSAPV
jgi:aerobic-type carbon monoxide dehydrogenase small subunit (CoxS/CutS family)